MKRTIAGVALVLLLGACAPPTDAVIEESPPTVSTETPSEAGPDIASWGEAAVYDDGLSVTLAQPTVFTPGEYAAGAEGFTTFVQFSVTVLNGTTEVYEPGLFIIQGTSGGQAMSQIFDGAMGGSPTAALLPGQPVTFTVGFGVADPADLTMDVAPGFEYGSMFWQGTAA